MSLTSTSSTAASPASNPISFPSDLASKIIWTPTIDDEDATAPTNDTKTADAPTTDTPASANDTLTPKFTFADGIISEVQAHIAHGLSPAVQMGIVKVHNLHLDDKKDKSIKEPLITVLYPRDGCHEIIDAAIRATAQDQEADVLVIDSLELALGELGAFGKGTVDIISRLYKEPVIPEEEESKEDGSKKEEPEKAKEESKDASGPTPKEETEKAKEESKDALDPTPKEEPEKAKEESKDTPDSTPKKEGSETAEKENAEEKDTSDSASEASSFEVVSSEKPSEEAKPSEEKPAEVTETSADAKPEQSGKTEEDGAKEEKKDEVKDDEKKDEEKKVDDKKDEEKKKEKKELTDEEKEKEEKRKQERIDKEKARQDRELQDVFDALVSIPPSGKDATKARIIYWRDFGNIAHSSEPILIRLFRAMHARRTAKFTKDSQSRDLLQPTILVLGDSKWITGERYSYQSPRSAFSRGGSALDKLLPCITHQEATLSNDKTSTELSVPSMSFFLTSMTTSDEDNEALSESYTAMFNGKFELSEFDVSGSTIAVFPERSDKKEFRKVEERLAAERKKVVANAWLRLALAQCGGTVSGDGDVLDAVSEDKEIVADLLKEEKKDAEKWAKKAVSYDSDDDEDAKKKKDEEKKEKEKETKDHICKGSRILDQLVKHTSSPLPVALERLVTAAFSIAPKPSEDATVEVSVSSFSKAYMTVNQNAKAKNSWWKKNKMPKAYYGTDSEDSDDESEDKDKDDKKKKEDPIIKKVKAAGDLTRYETRLLSSIVDIGDLDTSFDDVCISESTVETLRTIVSLPLLFPTAFKSGVLAKEAIGGVLLYGPPGTGKTLVCRAVAKECGARMLAIKPSDIMDCYVGESEKLVNAVFSLAYRLAPCLIFIDELDSLFRRRQNDDKKWVRDILAEFLQSMDGLRSAKKNKEAGVIVIGATNRPHDIDDAVLRRLPSRMIVDVPGEDEREKILKLHLRGETLEEGVTLAEIARKTINYSGSDLKNLCVSAAMASVKEALGTFSWKVPKSKDEEKKGEGKKDEEKKDEKKDEEKKDEKKEDEKKDEKKDDEKDEKKDDEQTVETEAAKERISKRTVKMSHFLQAMNEVPASSTSGSHSELRRWHEQFGKKSPVATTSKPSYGAGATGDSAAASSSYASRYGSYAGGGAGAGAGAGSTPRYGGYGSGESGSTPRYGVNSGDSSTSTTTPRYGSYAAGGTGGSVTSTPRFGAAASSADSTQSTTSATGDSSTSTTTPRYGSYTAGGTGGSVTSTPRFGAAASSADSTQTTTSATGDSSTPRYGAGATSGESVAARYGSGGFSASSYLSGIGKNGSTSATGYTPGAGVSRFGAGSYKYGGAQSAGEKSSATIEQEVVVPDSAQKQKDVDSEEPEP